MQKKCPKKGVIFVLNSMISYVYRIHPTIKMSTSLNAVSDLVVDNVYFVIVTSNVHDRRMRFPESS